MLPTQSVQERVLQKLPFVAHDILRVQGRVIEATTLTQRFRAAATVANALEK
jgi:hypothetical protein